MNFFGIDKVAKHGLPRHMKTIWIDKTEYRQIPEFNTRYVSSCGKVLSVARGRAKPLTLFADSDGYIRFSNKPHTRSTYQVHRAVLLAWVGPPPSPECSEVRHLNGDKTNNNLENLVWGTTKENGYDKRSHGSLKGLNNSQAKMTEDMVLDIREKYKNMSLGALMSIYPQFSKFAIWAAASGYTWSHLPGAIKGSRKCDKNAWREGASVRGKQL